MPVENIQFARVMRELGIQQVYALSPQAKRRANWMLETFQDRLVTDLNLAAASAIDGAGLVLKEFLLEAPGGVAGFPGELWTRAGSVPVVIVQQRQRAAGH